MAADRLRAFRLQPGTLPGRADRELTVQGTFSSLRSAFTNREAIVAVSTAMKPMPTNIRIIATMRPVQ